MSSERTERERILEESVGRLLLALSEAVNVGLALAHLLRTPGEAPADAPPKGITEDVAEPPVRHVFNAKLRDDLREEEG